MPATRPGMSGNRSGAIRIGISGWTYAPWRGVFYPAALPHRQELTYAAGKFDTLEINGTFYGLQTPDSYKRWRDATPDDFVFAVKGSRYITHMRRLRNIDTPLANFFASGLLHLGPKLGPLLWQFPPWMRFDEAVFDAFFALLPHDTHAALALARRHDNRIARLTRLRSDAHGTIRHAVEIRHDSFRVPAFINLLRQHDIALVCADTVEWPRLMDLTSGFVYCRLHGSEELYVSGYDDEALDAWAARVRAWACGGEPEDAERVMPPAHNRPAGRDVFVYFDNDAKVRAPFDALGLAARLGLTTRLSDTPDLSPCPETGT